MLRQKQYDNVFFSSRGNIPVSGNLQHVRVICLALSPLLTVCGLLHVKLSKHTRDALIRSGVGLVHQVGLIMQIPASSSLAGVRAVILMIKERWSDSRRRQKKGTVWECDRLWEKGSSFHLHNSCTNTMSVVCSFFSLQSNHVPAFLGCVQRGEESSPLSLSSQHFPFPQRHTAA